MDKRSKLARDTVLRATIKALSSHYDPALPVVLEGESYTVLQLQALFQEELDAMAGVAAATARRSAAVQKERTARARNKPILMALGNAVRNQFGPDQTVLNAFRLEPRKKGRKSAEVKRVAADKARATRVKRNTMGKRQRTKAPKGSPQGG